MIASRVHTHKTRTSLPPAGGVLRCRDVLPFSYSWPASKSKPQHEGRIGHGNIAKLIETDPALDLWRSLPHRAEPIADAVPRRPAPSAPARAGRWSPLPRGAGAHAVAVAGLVLEEDNRYLKRAGGTGQSRARATLRLALASEDREIDLDEEGNGPMEKAYGSAKPPRLSSLI
ncbi:hypothetical protein HU200_012047 [Digitaria exilis]|uniref:Uncharacterized protein n=1 Tax=Digitaria exilis TaxID=1010633 RepID=A0A835KM48_9POAL|nr:hypothetical protein HU200_012047 [Digitaria exilis]